MSALHLIDGTEPGAQEILTLAQRALALRGGAAPCRADGLRLGAVFFNPSLRTRTSLEAAAVALGIHPIILQPGTDAWGWSFEEGAIMDGDTAEHATEAIGVLSQYVDLLAVRSFARLVDPEEDRADPVIHSFVDKSPVPVINLESTRWHPLQGLADTATWVSRLGPNLQGRRVVIRWAPHPKALPAAVPQQALLSAALQGMDVVLAHPEGFELDPQVLTRATQLATAQGGQVSVQHHPEVSDAHVIYAKSWSGWSGYGRRSDEAAARAQLGAWQVRRDQLGQAGFMHCLPVRRNVVVEDAVLDSEASWVQEQAGLRLWTAMSALERMAGGPPWSS